MADDEVKDDGMDFEVAIVTDSEAIEAACRALDTITAYEVHADIQMLSKPMQARLKRIKRTAITIIDDGLKSLLGYYEDKPDEDDD